MSSCTIFFFVVIAEIARHSRVACCFKGFSLWKGTISLPSRRWLARFRSSTLPAQLFSVLGLLKTRKSRNREGPGERDERPFSWGCVGIVNGPAERTTFSSFLATVLLRQDPFLRVLQLLSSLPRMYRGP